MLLVFCAKDERVENFSQKVVSKKVHPCGAKESAYQLVGGGLVWRETKNSSPFFA